MEKIRTVDELDAAILLLENKRAHELISLKEQYNLTHESLKPLNLLRRTFKKLVTAPDFKEDLLNASLGIATGYLSKKIAIGSSENPVKQLLGSVLQMGVTSAVSKNGEGIRTKLMDMLSFVFKKKVD